MGDKTKTEKQILAELVACRERVSQLEASAVNEKIYFNLVENSPDVIYTLDPEGRFTYVGGACETLLGFKAEELIGKHFEAILHEEQLKRARYRFNERRTGDRSTRAFDVRLNTKGGKRKDFDVKDIPVELFAFGVYDKPRSSKEKRFLGTYGVARDITERKEAENRLKATLEELERTKDMLVQTEKLAAVGRLTAGVAHEILNPVNIIDMRLQLLMGSEKVSDQIRQSLEICMSQLSRITDIIGNLGLFSRVDKKQITVGDLNEVIEHALNLFSPQFKKEGITPDICYHSQLPPIPFESGRIAQVVFNILSNAAAAMAGKETRILRVLTESLDSAGFVRVSISDTGCGVDEGNMEKLFEPFFTTKEPGQGVGLGLYISYMIIQDHGGKILVKNNEWGGATFSVELPIECAVQSSLEGTT